MPRNRIMSWNRNYINTTNIIVIITIKVGQQRFQNYSISREKKKGKLSLTVHLLLFVVLVVGEQKCLAKRYGCQHHCIHLPDGGHRCICRHGYSLAQNGRHCDGKSYKTCHYQQIICPKYIFWSLKRKLWFTPFSFRIHENVGNKILFQPIWSQASINAILDCLTVLELLLKPNMPSIVM